MKLWKKRFHKQYTNYQNKILLHISILRTEERKHPEPIKLPFNSATAKTYRYVLPRDPELLILTREEEESMRMSQ